MVYHEGRERGKASSPVVHTYGTFLRRLVSSVGSGKFNASK